jgi:H+/Cl- antiporter ClcA
MPIAKNLLSFHAGFVGKWSLMILFSGITSGTASAFFLTALEWAAHTRDQLPWLVWLLPIGGLLIGLSYYYGGRDVEKGNNLILEEYYHPKKPIPFKMAPLVLFTTLATHLLGGSAGREGTAVQMGATFSDSFSHWWKIDKRTRRILLLMGMAGGFASVFGTPIAGAIFALEVVRLGKLRWSAVIPVALTAFLADGICHAWQVEHTRYSMGFIPGLTWAFLVWTLLAGVFFGGGSRLFYLGMEGFGKLFRTLLPYPPIRPVIGGLLLALVFAFSPTEKFMGLGIPTLLEAFEKPLPGTDFLLKTLFTTFTLSAGFKGGEVTPLFFIGATMGNMLAYWMPLPLGVLAGIGFVAVFAGATKTPFACIIMGLELFGLEALPFLIPACSMAYLCSARKGIYGGQRWGEQSWKIFKKLPTH